MHPDGLPDFLVAQTAETVEAEIVSKLAFASTTAPCYSHVYSIVDASQVAIARWVQHCIRKARVALAVFATRPADILLLDSSE